MYRIKEVKFVGGVAAATSIHNNNWRPESAFKPYLPENKGWHVNDKTRSLPVMIWYDFKSEGIRPAEVRISNLGIVNDGGFLESLFNQLDLKETKKIR